VCLQQQTLKNQQKFVGRKMLNVTLNSRLRLWPYSFVHQNPQIIELMLINMKVNLLNRKFCSLQMDNHCTSTFAVYTRISLPLQSLLRPRRVQSNLNSALSSMQRAHLSGQIDCLGARLPQTKPVVTHVLHSSCTTIQHCYRTG
jgi:hypothetical protein